MLKVAAYARVSTDKEDQINSLTNQRDYFESYIKSKGDWEFVEVYFDEGITGTQTKKRKGFNHMIIDDFLSEINPSALVFGGQIQPNLQKALEDNHIAYRDYLKREELSIKNAVPTALVIWLLIFGIVKQVIYSINSLILL